MLLVDKNDAGTRFVPCVNGVGLLKILLQAARRAITSNAHSVFPEGFKFTDGSMLIITWRK